MKKQTKISSTQLASLYRQAIEQGLSLSKLEAKIGHKLDQHRVSKKIETEQEQKKVKTMRRSLPKAVRYGALILPLVFIGVGLFLLGNAAVPLGQYYVKNLAQLGRKKLIAPIPEQEVLDVTPLVVDQVSQGQTAGVSHTQDGPVILDTELDYTNLSNWFKDERAQALVAGGAAESRVVAYTLEIPELEIEQAEVVVGGTNLDDNLIAYPGTALPGETGAPVIFGHSVLRQFYNPSLKNPRRYNSIFSYIMTLEPGDAIFVTHDNAEYKYVVRDKTEVKPEDTYILAQQHNSRKLKLVTCVPEGTYLRRGVVTAELVSY